MSLRQAKMFYKKKSSVCLGDRKWTEAGLNMALNVIDVFLTQPHPNDKRECKLMQQMYLFFSFLP